MKEVDLDQLQQFVMDPAGPSDGPKIRPFRYVRPALTRGRQRGVCLLGRTDIMLGAVQIFESGGEHVRHAHVNMDGFWLVLKGVARFNFDNEVIDLQPMEGLIVPRGVAYWFETIGDEPLEILQVDSIHPKLPRELEYDPADEELMQGELRGSALFDAGRS